MKIFLVGYMGCGKTSMGKELARRTGYRFVDTDREIENRLGKTVREIFAERGEVFFRNAEKEIIEDVVKLNENLIVSTGGGLPCFHGNMDLMNTSGHTVYFKMTPEKLKQRLEFGIDKRPVLQGKTEEELVEFIRESLAVREKFYGQAALVIDCDGVSDDYICAHIVSYIDTKVEGA